MYCIVFPVDNQTCNLHFIESELYGGNRVQLHRRNSTYLYYMYRNEQWLVNYVGHDPKPFYEFNLKYDTKGKWLVTPEYNSNLSFTAKLKLVRYPVFYVRLFDRVLD